MATVSYRLCFRNGGCYLKAASIVPQLPGALAPVVRVIRAPAGRVLSRDDNRRGKSSASIGDAASSNSSDLPQKRKPRNLKTRPLVGVASSDRVHRISHRELLWIGRAHAEALVPVKRDAEVGTKWL